MFTIMMLSIRVVWKRLQKANSAFSFENTNFLIIIYYYLQPDKIKISSCFRLYSGVEKLRWRAEYRPPLCNVLLPLASGLLRLSIAHKFTMPWLICHANAIKSAGVRPSSPRSSSFSTSFVIALFSVPISWSEFFLLLTDRICTSLSSPFLPTGVLTQMRSPLVA